MITEIELDKTEIEISFQAWRAAYFFHNNIRGLGNDVEKMAKLVQLAINNQTEDLI